MLLLSNSHKIEYTYIKFDDESNGLSNNVLNIEEYKNYVLQGKW